MLDRPNKLRAFALGAALLVAMSGSSSATSGDGTTMIVNGTRTAMIMLSVKDSRAEMWQSELLGRKPLGVQKETVFYRDRNACMFDVRAMFEDGHRVTKQRVDFCRSPRYILTDF